MYCLVIYIRTAFQAIAILLIISQLDAPYKIFAAYNQILQCSIKVVLCAMVLFAVRVWIVILESVIVLLSVIHLVLRISHVLLITTKKIAIFVMASFAPPLKIAKANCVISTIMEVKIPHLSYAQ